jgi:hypothetical protein
MEMQNMSDKHIQKAGDCSQQLQADVINVYNGITEARAKEINAESLAIAMRDFSYEAEQKVVERVRKLEDRVMPRLYRIEGALQNFADPSFQNFLIKANKAAACTDRELDYDLLSELLIHRIEKKDSRKAQIGLNKAVEIVDQITDEALNGLTVFFVIGQYTPIANTLEKGLSVLNNLYTRLPLSGLPSGLRWLEDLDILDAVRINSFGELKKLEQFWADIFPGFVTAGIKKDGDKWVEVTNLLKECNLPINVLTDNVLLEGYVLVPVITKQEIDSLKWYKVSCVEDPTLRILFSDAQKQVLHKIYSMYDN